MMLHLATAIMASKRLLRNGPAGPVVQITVDNDNMIADNRGPFWYCTRAVPTCSTSSAVEMRGIAGLWLLMCDC